MKAEFGSRPKSSGLDWCEMHTPLVQKKRLLKSGIIFACVSVRLSLIYAQTRSPLGLLSSHVNSRLGHKNLDFFFITSVMVKNFKNSVYCLTVVSGVLFIAT